MIFGKFTEKGNKMLKKFAFIIFAMGFIHSVFADSNTIDFQSITPPQNSTSFIQPNTLQSGYKSTKIGDFDFEFGIGYVMSKFKAKQEWGDATDSSSATGHGADIYFNGSYYVSESFGVMIGMGTEIINIDWNDPLYELSCYLYCNLDTNSNDLLWSIYLNFGAFKNLWQNDKSSLRIFGNVGLSLNWLVGGFYENTITCSAYGCQTTLEAQKAFSFPLSIGLRYMFVENHGLELVGKYDLMDWDFSTKAPDAPSFDTTISRNLSIALRYVYKFD